MKKVNIMLIAPYKGLIYMFEEMVAKRNDIELHCLLGDTTNASNMIQRLPFDKYDILVSRGHTCTLLQQSCHRHIVDVGVSIYDLLCSIRMAQNFMGKFAVVGFKNIVYYAHVLNELMQYQAKIVTLNNTKEIPAILQNLKQQGYSLIVGDVVTINAAQDIGLQTILITTSIESVKHTLNSCVAWFQEQEKFRETLQIHDQILKHCDENIMVLSKTKGCLFYKSEGNDEQLKRLEQSFYNYIDNVLQKKEIRFFKTVGEKLYSIRAYNVAMPKDAAVFYYREEMLWKQTSRFISFHDLKTLPIKECEFAYLLTSSVNSVLALIKTMQNFTRPIIIEGGYGSGKDILACMIYKQSKLQNTPFIIIDCRFIQTKEWRNLLTNDNSILLRKNQTIYFKNLHFLGNEEQRLLYELLKYSPMSKFNHLIFSYNTSNSNRNRISELLHEILNSLHAIVAYTPDLNKHKQEMSTLLTWYLNDFNSKMSKQVIAFQPEAIAALQNFNFTGNFKQLKRIVYRLLTETSTPYITEKAVVDILNKEQASKTAIDPTNAYKNGTLEEITTSIIQAIYKQENYNQTRTAKRLGIGRTTLRRKLGLQ